MIGEILLSIKFVIHQELTRSDTSTQDKHNSQTAQLFSITGIYLGVGLVVWAKVRIYSQK